MNYFAVCFCCNLLYPVILVILGGIMRKHYPKEINHFIGYRTGMSMINAETWAFAQKDCAKRMWKAGRISFPFFIIFQLPFYNKSETAVTLLTFAAAAVGISVIIFTALQTEKALKRNFTDDGFRKKIDFINPENKYDGNKD